MSLVEGASICSGKYEILRLIGEGGQSRVWLGREVSRGLLIAIKEPLMALSPAERDEIQERFQRELQISGKVFQVEAPNVVRALTVEQHDGVPLLVLEYCPGGSIADLLKRGPVPTTQTVSIALQLCAALTVIHGKLGLVHRDIKPSNILLGADGTAKLSDFGLAQTGESRRSQLTAGSLPGTAGYMSPEQESTTGYLAPASDLYSLGCVLFEMLTGRMYQRERTGTRVCQLQKSVPSWLDDTVARLLKDDAWERYRTAGDVAASLRGGRQARRRSVCPIGLAVGMTLALAVLWVALRRSAQPANGTPRVEQPAMVLVPAGEFIMGADPGAYGGQPQHRVYLDAFLIGTTEVTNAEFRRFLDDGGHSMRQLWSEEGWRWKEENGIGYPEYWYDSRWNQPDLPVVGLSWYEAAAYAEWIGGRLPTEAEWEKAARGTGTNIYPWGNDWDGRKLNSCDANCGGKWADHADDGYQYTAPVGTYPAGASPYGALDMSGNVSEWVADWYDERYYEYAPGRNPSGPDAGSTRSVRGGCWLFDKRVINCAARWSYHPSYRSDCVGFRVAK